MKKTFIMLLLTMMGSSIFAQTESGGLIYAFGSYVDSEVFRFKELDGDGSYYDGNGYAVGVNYGWQIVDKWWFNSGLENYRVENIYAFPYTGLDQGIYEYTVVRKSICIPLELRYFIYKWLYVQGGATIEFNKSVSSPRPIRKQTGFGTTLSAGIYLPVIEKLYIKVQPKLSLNSLVNISDSNKRHYKFMEVRCGIAYAF